jgi:Flp pilus assembly protein TadD
MTHLAIGAMVVALGSGAMQAPTLSDSARANRRLWAAMRRLSDAESKYLTAAAGKLDTTAARRVEPLAAERDLARESAAMLLDSVAANAPWGLAETRAILAAYPGSPLVMRVLLRESAKRGNNADVLELSEKLIRSEPRDPAAHISRAVALDHAGRTKESKTSYARALELAPEDSTAYRALLRMQQADGTLTELFERVDRIAIRLPKSRVLAERRIELLHRLGRTAEAEAAAKALRERP